MTETNVICESNKENTNEGSPITDCPQNIMPGCRHPAFPFSHVLFLREYSEQEVL